MRPAPPEPNTANTGRIQKYKPLVEPDMPTRKERAVVAAIAVGGFSAAVLIDAALRLWT